MKKEDIQDKMAFIKSVQKKDKFFFHYLLGWMASDHLEDMVDAAYRYEQTLADAGLPSLLVPKR